MTTITASRAGGAIISEQRGGFVGIASHDVHLLVPQPKYIEYILCRPWPRICGGAKRVMCVQNLTGGQKTCRVQYKRHSGLGGFSKGNHAVTARRVRWHGFCDTAFANLDFATLSEG